MLPGFGLTFGFTTFFLCAIVLLPLAALVLKTASMSWAHFVDVVTDPRALASYRLTFGASLVAAAHQHRVRLHRGLDAGALPISRPAVLDAMIDMPFALPTAVSGHRAHGGIRRQRLDRPVPRALGIKVAYTWLGVTVALTLIGLPFVVRSVQPSLLELQKDLEEAAETLGASPALHLPARHLAGRAAACSPASRWPSPAPSANTAR